MNDIKKLNLLITVFDLHFGGISTLILQTIPALSKNLNIYVVYFGPKEEMLNRYLDAGISTTRIPYYGPKDLLKVGKKLSEFIKQNQIDVVSTHLFIDKLIVMIAKFHVKFKLLSTLHSAQNPYLSGINKISISNKLEDIYHNYLVDTNIAVSQASLKSWKTFRGLTNNNSKVLYSGIAKLPCDKIQSENFDDKVKIFVTACRFTEEKGLERLIYLFNNIKKDQNWILWIIGDGILREKLEQLVVNLNMEDRILFKGFQTELCQYYKYADFYLNSSFHEALGVSILEAMSVGLPVLGSKVGGIPEIISHGIDGYLIDFHNVNQGINILNMCLNMKRTEYELFSNNSKMKFENKFSLDKYVQVFTREIELLVNP